MKRHLIYCLATFGLLLSARPATAHFPWLTITKDGKGAYFFGETPADRTYKMPTSIAKAEVGVLDADGQAKKVELKRVDSDDFVGMTSAESIDAKATLVSQVTYGIYNGSRLNYTT